MNSLTILLFSIVFFVLGYRFYGRFAERRFGTDSSRETPAHTRHDGVDYVPAGSSTILFGHHFAAIAGAGPIIGPVLACAYWGWGPTLLWVLVGSVLIGGIHDFAALIMSIRNNGESIAEVARLEISPRARVFFSFFVWLSLILVVAVFSLFTAKTFVIQPDIVVPSFGSIPIAILFGWLVYHRRFNTKLATLVGLVGLALAMVLGVKFPITIGSIGGVSPESAWVIVLLIYCFFASVTPVQILLQPRDYLTSFLLFGAVLFGIFGVCITRLPFNAPFFQSFSPKEWLDAGPLWPMLFVTVACGAVSGFHSLVSSGTSSKQIASERHARAIGYGAMLMEGLVAVIVIICVSAGLAWPEVGSSLRENGPIVVFSSGFGRITESMLGNYGRVFAVMVLNAFVLSSLDAATRITRYLTGELFKIRNIYISTFVVVLVSALFALSGQWQKIWPAFGASNQLVAGLTLLVASCWLLRRGKGFWMTLAPAIVMLITTIGAFCAQFVTAIQRKVDGVPSPDFVISGIALVLTALAAFVAFETYRTFRRALSQKRK